MLWYQPHSTLVAYTYLQPFGNFATGITWDLFKMNRDIFPPSDTAFLSKYYLKKKENKAQIKKSVKKEYHSI